METPMYSRRIKRDRFIELVKGKRVVDIEMQWTDYAVSGDNEYDAEAVFITMEDGTKVAIEWWGAYCDEGAIDFRDLAEV